MIRGTQLLQGVTLSGGEPFAQAEVLAAFAKQVKVMGLDKLPTLGILLKNSWRCPRMLKVLSCC